MTATLNLQQVSEYLLATEETGLPISLLKRHLQMVGEKGVCDPQLSGLHKSGLYTDLLEASRLGNLGSVDRTIFRHLLGLPMAETVAVTGLPGVASYDPATGIYRWEVDYDQTIAEKLAVKDPSRIGWATDYATDEKFPDERCGKRVVTGRIWYPGKNMGQDDLPKKCNGTLALPKELIDFARAFPRPAFDNDLPLAGAGQFWTNADGHRYYLCLDRGDAERRLSDVWLNPGEQLGDVWRFLVLDK